MYVSVEFKTNKQTWILLNKKSYLLSSMLFRYVPFDAKFEDFNKNVFISKGEFQSLKIENVKICALAINILTTCMQMKKSVLVQWNWILIIIHKKYKCFKSIIILHNAKNCIWMHLFIHGMRGSKKTREGRRSKTIKLYHIIILFLP